MSAFMQLDLPDTHQRPAGGVLAFLSVPTSLAVCWNEKLVVHSPAGGLRAGPRRHSGGPGPCADRVPGARVWGQRSWAHAGPCRRRAGRADGGHAHAVPDGGAPGWEPAAGLAGGLSTARGGALPLSGEQVGRLLSSASDRLRVHKLWSDACVRCECLACPHPHSSCSQAPVWGFLQHAAALKCIVSP